MSYSQPSVTTVFVMTVLVKKTLRNILTMFSTLLLAGCASTTAPAIRTMDYVDLDRFAGEWFVIAVIPTFIEKQAYNAVEIYAPPEDGVVHTTFRFNEGGFDGPEKEYTPTGFVREGTGNAVWGMQFIWPIKAEYRIVYVDDAYEVTIIGRSKRDYVWIMARQPELSEETYARLTRIVAQEGYDVDKLRVVPHRKSP
jgi:apolipoprotein D and lipocalin family protein